MHVWPNHPKYKPPTVVVVFWNKECRMPDNQKGCLKFVVVGPGTCVNQVAVYVIAISWGGPHLIMVGWPILSTKSTLDGVSRYMTHCVWKLRNWKGKEWNIVLELECHCIRKCDVPNKSCLVIPSFLPMSICHCRFVVSNTCTQIQLNWPPSWPHP